MSRPFQSVPLSPIDHLFTGNGAYPIQLLFQFPGKVDLGRWKDSFASTLNDFFPLSSELALSDEGRYELRFRRDHFLWVENTLAEDLLIDKPPAVAKLFSNVESFPGEILTKARVYHSPHFTYLALSLSHCLVDGYSFFLFLAAWSAKFHGRPFLIPNHNRQLLMGEVATGEIDPDRVLSESGLFWLSPRAPLAEQRLAWEMYQYNREEISQWKIEAKQSTSRPLTDNDVLVAGLAKRILKVDGSRRYVSCPVDFRRLHPAVDKTYFGNAVRCAIFEIDDAKLTGPLGQIALLTRDAVDSTTPESVAKALGTLELLRKKKGVGAFAELHVTHPDNGLLVTNLSRVPCDAIDFGTGTARAIRSATPASRTAMVVATATGLGILYNYPVK